MGLEREGIHVKVARNARWGAGAKHRGGQVPQLCHGFRSRVLGVAFFPLPYGLPMPHGSPLACGGGDDAEENVIEPSMPPNDRPDAGEEANGLSGGAGRPSGRSPPDPALANGLDSRSAERSALRLEGI